MNILSCSWKCPVSLVRGRRAIGVISAFLMACTLSGRIQAQDSPVTEGLQLWLRADAGITTNEAGNVTEWQDQSGQDNHAVQLDEFAAPLLVSDAINGRPAVFFDGEDDFLDVATSPSIEIAGDISSYFVVRFADFETFRAVWGKTVVNLPASTDYYLLPSSGIPRAYRGSGVLPDIASVDGTMAPRPGVFVILGFQMEGTTFTHYFNGLPAGSGELTAPLVDGGTPLKVGSRDDLFTKMEGEIAELLIYDRSLAETERATVIGYLQQKYGLGNELPTITVSAPANNAQFTAPTNITFTVEANDPDGSIARVDFLANGAVLGSVTNAPFSLPVQLLSPGTVQFWARVVDDKDASAISQTNQVTVTAAGGETPSFTGTNGLQLWLRADAGVTTGADGAVTRWTDQSGAGNDAIQFDETMAPVLTEDAVNGQPALRFDGVDDYLEVAASESLGITGDIASFFVVSFADFETFRAVWGKTSINVPRPNDYYLLPSSGIPRVFRGSDETGENQFVDGAGSVPANTYVLLGFSQEGEVMTHYLNGQPFGSGNITLTPTDAGTPLMIGTREDFLTRMSGDIAELFIFDRAISGEEQVELAGYLGSRYGIPIVVAGEGGPSEPGDVRFTNFGLDGDSLILEWAGTLVLEEAVSVTGPWTAVTGSASPFSAPVTEPMKFYRLRQP